MQSLLKLYFFHRSYYSCFLDWGLYLYDPGTFTYDAEVYLTALMYLSSIMRVALITCSFYPIVQKCIVRAVSVNDDVIISIIV